MKCDFLVAKKNPATEKYSKLLNIEVNFYSKGGSKPDSIIMNYITRQSDLKRNGIEFVLITDGNNWKGVSNLLDRGFKDLDYIMNYRMAQEGMLCEVISKVFSE